MATKLEMTIDLTDFYWMGECCVSEFVQRVTDASEVLTTLIRLGPTDSRVKIDAILDARREFLKQIGNIKLCYEGCNFPKPVSDFESEVVADTGLA